MPTLILSPRFTEDTVALARVAEASGWIVERLQSWQAPVGLIGQEVAVYGGELFAVFVAQELGLALLTPSFDWLPNLPTEYRQRQVTLATLEEARKLSQPTFVKPAASKCFPAGVIASGTILPQEDVLPGETSVLLSEPVTWEVEFRCFVLEREVLTLSPYLRSGELAQSEDGSWQDDRTEQARAFAQQILMDKNIALPEAVVIDVGIIVERGWAVVEANAAWCSGIYGCDPDQVLRVVERTCLRSD
jgi:hypothetical protein